MLLSEQYGAWQVIYRPFRRWKEMGVFLPLLDIPTAFPTAFFTIKRLPVDWSTYEECHLIERSSRSSNAFAESLLVIINSIPRSLPLFTSMLLQFC